MGTVSLILKEIILEYEFSYLWHLKIKSVDFHEIHESSNILKTKDLWYWSYFDMLVLCELAYQPSWGYCWI